MFKNVLLAFSLLFLGLALLVLRPVPIVSEKEAIIGSGVILTVYEGGVKDVVFRVENDPRKFYINRGLESGLHLDELKNKLIGKKVIFKYPAYWTPLDWYSKIRHISKLELEGEVIFNELK